MRFLTEVASDPGLEPGALRLGGARSYPTELIRHLYKNKEEPQSGRVFYFNTKSPHLQEVLREKLVFRPANRHRSLCSVSLLGFRSVVIRGRAEKDALRPECSLNSFQNMNKL